MSMVNVIIGIAGASGSGKSTIAKKLFDAFQSDSILITHDSYYKNHPKLMLDERASMNFDHPDSLETDLLVEHLKMLKAGKSIMQPQYDYATHLRKSEHIDVLPKRAIIVEGILIFSEPKLRDMMDLKVFVDTDTDICLLRRIKRDVEKRGRTLSSVLEQYKKTVKPMYHEFVEPSKRYADIIIPEGGYNDVANKVLMARLRAIILAAGE
jgi:uridine kinase